MIKTKWIWKTRNTCVLQIHNWDFVQIFQQTQAPVCFLTWQFALLKKKWSVAGIPWYYTKKEKKWTNSCSITNYFVYYLGIPATLHSLSNSVEYITGEIDFLNWNLTLEKCSDCLPADFDKNRLHGDI